MKSKKMKILIVLILISFIIIVAYTILKKDFYLKSEESKENIISVFNKNVRLFSNIKDYSETMSGNIYIHKSYDTSTILYKNSTSEGIKDIKIENGDIDKKILHLINDLKFIGIYEDNKAIKFTKKSDVLEQGILYIESDSIPDYYTTTNKIIDKWYYYEIYHE